MDKAIQEFQAALKFKPDDPVFRRNLARALQMQKSVDAERNTK